MSVTHHLVARGVDEFTQRVRNIQDGPEHVYISPAAYTILALTTVLFVLFSAEVRYTYGQVVATLAMVETPTSTAIVRTPPVDSDEKDALLMDTDQKTPIEHELLIVKSKPLTAKFKTIIKHLVSRAGHLSRFRGLGVFLGYEFAFHLLSALGRALPGGIFARSLVHVLVTVGLCRIALLWNHVVISEPSPKTWYRRIVTRAVGSKIVVPTLFFAIHEQASVLVPVMLARCFRLHTVFTNPNVSLAAMTDAEQLWVLLKVAVAGLVGFLCFVGIYLPVKIALTRVQASLLASEEETIVPVDRSFGGKVLPNVMDGYGKQAMKEAFNTFDWNSRIRVFKVYAKIALIQFALFTMWAFVTLFELRWAIGADKFDRKVFALLQATQN